MPAKPTPEIAEKKPTIGDRILGRLSRVTSSGRFVPEIDGLRFFAIAGVIFSHLAILIAEHGAYATSGVVQSLFFNILETWTDGVRLFFSISGFILSLPFAEHHLMGRPRPNLAKYYARRVTRLEPPYIICLTVGLVGVCVYGSTFHEEIAHYLASLVYLHALVYHQPSTIGGILWSLEVEVQFYILAPFLTQIFRLRPVLRRTILGVAIVALMTLPSRIVQDPNSISFLDLTIVGNLRYFLVGFLASDLYLTGWNQPRPKNYIWDVVLIGGYFLCLVVGYYARVAIYLRVFPLLVLLAYAASFRGHIFSRIVTHRWLVAIGGMCYTIYLYHMIIIRAMSTAGMKHLMLGANCYVDYAIQAIIICPVLLVVTSLLFIAFEKPFMQRDWPKRWKAVIRSVLFRQKTDAC